jgi:hypothetical protein
VTLTLTNTALLNARNALAQLAGVRLPAKAAYGIARAAKAVDDALRPLDDARKRIAEQHARKGDDGAPVVVNEDGVQSYEIDDRAAFVADMAVLMEQETDLPGVRTLRLSDLGAAEVTPGALYALDWLIQADPEDPA